MTLMMVLMAKDKQFSVGASIYLFYLFHKSAEAVKSKLEIKSIAFFQSHFISQIFVHVNSRRRLYVSTPEKAGCHTCGYEIHL